MPRAGGGRGFVFLKAGARAIQVTQRGIAPECYGLWQDIGCWVLGLVFRA